jgi:hypothetical protein|tara:strand:+ start:705 stop:1373 length:669 start_codon:yes stop_codon:yes gene_type:complete
MAKKINISLTDTVGTLRQSTNAMSDYVGEPDNLATTNKSDLVQAINEINSNTGASFITSRLSLASGGDGGHTTLSYDSSSGTFQFNCNAIGPGDFNTALPATIIASGVFAAARIPALDASIINSGVLNTARIPALNTISGTLTSSQIGFNSGNIPENTNLFHTTARARASISAGHSHVVYNSTSGEISLDSSSVLFIGLAELKTYLSNADSFGSFVTTINAL